MAGKQAKSGYLGQKVKKGHREQTSAVIAAVVNNWNGLRKWLKSGGRRYLG
jgi:hypothetical protein